jgi:hypothetical protein
MDYDKNNYYNNKLVIQNFEVFRYTKTCKLVIENCEKIP